MSQVVEIELPDELPAALQKEAGELAGELRLAAAVKWYEMSLLSQGKAAEVAGLSRAKFLAELARFGVSPFQETADEILAASRDASKWVTSSATRRHSLSWQRPGCSIFFQNCSRRL